MSATPLRDRVNDTHAAIMKAIPASRPLELQTGLIYAVAGIASALAQTNVAAADAVLAKVAEALGVDV